MERTRRLPLLAAAALTVTIVAGCSDPVAAPEPHATQAPAVQPQPPEPHAERDRGFRDRTLVISRSLTRQVSRQARSHRDRLARLRTAAHREADRIVAAEERAARERAEQRRREAAAAAAEAEAAEAEHPPATTAPVSGNRALGRQLMLAAGFGPEQWPALEALWTRESGWNHLAANPSSGAYGIPQSLPGSKMAAAGADWATNPATQIRWGLGYIRDRYGTPAAALAHSDRVGWY